MDTQFDCIRVNEMLNKWITSDYEISEFADDSNRVLIIRMLILRIAIFKIRLHEKLSGSLLAIFSNEKLIELFTSHLDAIKEEVQKNQFLIELGNEGIYVWD